MPGFSPCLLYTSGRLLNVLVHQVGQQLGCELLILAVGRDADGPDAVNVRVVGLAALGYCAGEGDCLLYTSSRGEVALIVAQKGEQAGLIDPHMFPPIVLVVIVTTLVTPILLKFGMKKQTPANTEFSAQEAANMPKNSRF